MMRPDAKVEKVYLYPKPVDFRKSIDGLAALVKLDIKVAVFDPVLFVFLNKLRIPRHLDTQPTIIWTLVPCSLGHLIHVHLDRQSERSDAGLHC